MNSRKAKEKVDVHITLHRNIPAQKKALEILEQYQQNYGLNKRDSLVFILLAYGNSFNTEAGLNEVSALVQADNPGSSICEPGDPAVINTSAEVVQASGEKELLDDNGDSKDAVEEVGESGESEQVPIQETKQEVDSAELFDLLRKNYGV